MSTFDEILNGYRVDDLNDWDVMISSIPESAKMTENKITKPNTLPIPEGTVRRFHVTNEKNIESIRQNGLTMQHTKGIEGPRAIYSWKTWEAAKDYGGTSPIVEFYHPENAYDSNPYATYMEVTPDQILAIHEDWHEHYRYFKKHPGAYEDTKLWKDLDKFPDYKRAVQQIDLETLNNESRGYIMSKFDEIMRSYRADILNEADGMAQPQPSPAPAPAGASPAMPPGGDPAAGGEPAAEPEGPSPEDIVKELEKGSKKPWAELASVLARAIYYKFTEVDRKHIDSLLPGALTLSDFVNLYSEAEDWEGGEPAIKNIHSPNVVSAAIRLFDSILPQVMKTDINNVDMDPVKPAEDI